jgi:hypothetical protein
MTECANHPVNHPLVYPAPIASATPHDEAPDAYRRGIAAPFGN